MNRKRISFCLPLLFLAFTNVNAQELKTDSVTESSSTRNVMADSLQALTNELAKLKSDVSKLQNDARLEKVWKRKKYWKLGYTSPTIERTDGEDMEWKTDYAISLQKGKTAYLHSKPIWGMVKFGIDYGYMDLSYAKLKLKSIGGTNQSKSTGTRSTGSEGFDDIVSEDPSGSITDMLGIDLGMHKFEYGWHVGPSISVNPWDHLIIAAYFHAMPTFSGILENDEFSYGFGCATSAGISVAYKSISVGVEGLWSKIKYKQSSFDDDDDDSDSEDDKGLFKTKNFKLRQKGPRFYIAIKF